MQNPDGNVNDSNDPANTGDIVVAYLTGQGQVDNFAPTGQIAPSSPLARPVRIRRSCRSEVFRWTGIEVALNQMALPIGGDRICYITRWFSW
jgi:hypothetical protein